jgi:hypothetical protein
MNLKQGVCKVVAFWLVSLRNRRFVPVEAISLQYPEIASPKNGSQ